jgi:hypothetical protein
MNDFITQIKIAESAKLKALSGLHAELGYPSAQALANAILGAAGAAGAVKKTTGSPSASTSSEPKRSGGGRGRRVPDSIRAAIKSALKAGETAAGLPDKFGVSYNIIHALKKEIGMVTARSKSKKR